MRSNGAIRSAPAARWMEWTAEETVHASSSEFRWEARMSGRLGALLLVTDAYEERRGFLAIRVAGLPVKKYSGVEFDKGEIQRYLSSFAMCPAMLFNIARRLEWVS